MKAINSNIAVLGGGPAGYVAAIRAAQLGASVVLVEEKDIGGVCLNIGCIPTKALLKTAEISTSIKRSKEFGIESSQGDINWNASVSRKDRVVKTLNTGVEQLLVAHGVIVVKARGIVVSDKKIIAKNAEEEIEINYDKLIIATGAKPIIPQIDGINLDGIMTSTEALNMDLLPSNMVIIGAGVIGLEFAAMLAPLGVKITIIEFKNRILIGEDEEIAVELQKSMKRQGIAFKLSAKVTEIQKSENMLEVTYSMGDKTYIQSCEKVLVAVGRKLNQDAFSELSLKIKDGAIITDNRMETNIKGIYAAGDITGGKLLAHLAFMEGRIAAENAMGRDSHIDYSAVPTCVYTHPEIATVGIDEEMAKSLGVEVKIGRFNYRNNGRALTLGEREGFVKVIADTNNQIIGAQILGINASEIISELTLAIKLKATADDLTDMIHPHPSLSEAIWEACGDIVGKAIHKI